MFLQIVDAKKMNDMMSMSRKGVGFSIKFELGPGREEMEQVEFRRRLDDYIRQSSKVYETSAGGKIYNHLHEEHKGPLFAYNKYVVTGKMRGGYVRKDMKFGVRVGGHQGGKLRNGLPWAGEE